jgi:hypothetical protein
MALAGSVVAAMKPATSNADNAIESFMLFSLYQRLQMIPERPAFRCSPLMSAMERLTTASPAGLIPIKGTRCVRRTTSAIPVSVNRPRRPQQGHAQHLEITAVDQPNNRMPFIAVIGPSRFQRLTGVTSP